MKCLVISIILTAFTSTVTGYAKIAVSVSLSNNVQITTTGWRKLTSWSAPISSGHVISGTKLTDGEFTAPISGLYSIYSTVTFSGADQGSFKILVLINNDFQNTHPGLQSSFLEATSFQSLSIFGAVRLQAEDSIAIFVYSKTDTNWIIIGNSETTFSVEFVGFYAGIPGFSSHLIQGKEVQEETWQSLLKWKASGKPGLFISRTGFSEDAGSFSPICKGVYQISANVEFNARNPGVYLLGIVHNGDPTGNTMRKEESKENSTFTLSLSVTLFLKQGDIVVIKTKGSSNYKITANSGFYGLKLNNGENTAGLSTVVIERVIGNGRTWISIPIPKPTSGHGQYDANPGSISSGKYYHTDSTIFTVSGVIHIKGVSSTSVILSLINDGSSLLVSKTGVFSTHSHDTDQTSYSIAGILQLPANQPLSLYIYLTNQEEYTIMNGSRLSIALTQQEYEAFHVATPVTIEFSKGNQYIPLDAWKLAGMGTYSFTSQFSNGFFTAGVTGIYYFSTNIIILGANGPISVVIALQGDTSKRRSLHSTKGNPSSTVDTLSVTGAMFVQAKSSAAVHVMVENDVSWSVGSGSTFSVVFMGQSFAVEGVSTVLQSRIPVTSFGWTKVNGWKPQAMDNSMFDSGGTFDWDTGVYTVPKTGMYLFSASIKLQDASAKLSSFLLTVVIDGSPSKYARQNGLQDYIENNVDPPSSNDYYSLVISGVLSVAKNQTLSIYIQSVGDNAYSISQDSSFSIIYLTDLNAQFGSGMQLMLSDSITQVVTDATYWRKIRYWVQTRGATTNAPGIFYDGPLQEVDTAAGNIKILETGLYLINANVAITDGDDEFEIAIHTTEGVTSLISKYGQTVRKKYTLKLFGVMFLTTDQFLSVRVRSTSPTASWENLQAYTGLSFARIPQFVTPVSINSALNADTALETGQSLWSRVRYWTTSSAPVQELSGKGLNKENGYFVAEYTGIYLVSTSVTYKLNTTGSHIVRQKIGINGDTSLPGSKVFDSGYGAVLLIPACEDTCASPITQLVQLNNGDKIAVYVQSSLPEVLLYKSTSFTIKYLTSLHPMPDGFSMELKETTIVYVYGDKQLIGWIPTSYGGQFYKDSGGSRDEYLISQSGLYLVSINIQFMDLNGWAVATPSLDNIPTLSASYFSEVESSFTIAVVGMLFINVGAVYTVTIQTDRDQFYKVAQTSSSSLTHVGAKETTFGFTATFNKKISKVFVGKQWNTIGSWSTAGKDWLFESDSGFETKESYIVPIPGYYLVAANVVVSNSGNKSSPIEVSLVRNNINDFTNGLYSRKVISAGGKITLQIHGGIFLNKWDFLQLQFMIHSSLELTFEQESTYSIVKLGDETTSVPCIDAGPNIVGRIVPDDVRKKIGTEVSWSCFATGDSPTYQWTKNLQDIPQATGSQFSLERLTLDNSGAYICSAASNTGVRAFSNIVKLTVFDPKPTVLNAVGELTLLTPENGPLQLQLLEIKTKAESFETDTAEMTFEIISGDKDNIFMLLPTRSFHGTTLARTKELDREVTDKYVLLIKVNNEAMQGEYSLVNITIVVTDVNDNAPLFESNTYNTLVYENTTLFTVVFTVKATDKDIGKNANIEYSLIPGSATGVFLVEKTTGNVLLQSQLDRESKDYYVLPISAYDGEHHSYTELTIIIGDVNEHAPYYLKTDYTVEVPETIIPGNSILRLLTNDNDTGRNAKLTYTIVHGDNDHVFTVTEMGDLQVSNTLDYEKNTSFTLTISVRDNGEPPLTGQNNATVIVFVRNTNDNRPLFLLPEYKRSINENEAFFKPQFIVSARDPDGDGVTYKIPSDQNVTNVFDVVYLTGIVELQQPLDYEKKQYYQFVIQASDVGLPPKVSTTNVLITVLDVNDNRPIFHKNNDMITVVESSESGRFIYQVSAKDLDSGANGLVSYRITEGNTEDMFYVNLLTGAVVASRPLDREKVSFYRLKISAFDGGDVPLSSLIPFTLDVTISDANDNKPIFDKSEYLITMREDMEIGSSIATFTIHDPDDGDNGRFNVSVKEITFQTFFKVIHQTDALYDLKILQKINFEERSEYQFTIVAEDFGSPKLEKSVSVTVRIQDVNDNPPRFQSPYYTATLSNIMYANFTVYQMVATDPDIGPGGRLSYEIIGGNVGAAFIIDQYSGIVRTAVRLNLTFLPIYELQIIAKDTYNPPLISNITILYVRVTRNPNILLTNEQIGKYQISAKIDLKDFAHLDNLKNYEVLVQIYEPDNPDFNIQTSAIPTTWYNVFSSLSNTWYPSNTHLLRYRALAGSYPTDEQHINVVIGNNMSCTSIAMQNEEICNGPLAAGKTYRFQVRVFERDNRVPIDSYFSHLLTLVPIGPNKAALSETTEDGMMALAASFCIVFAVVILAILVLTCWKMRHELIYVDHLRDSHEKQFDIVNIEKDGDRFFGAGIGQFAGFENGNLWPQLSMTEHNQMLQRSVNNTSGVLSMENSQSSNSFKPEYNLAYDYGENEEELGDEEALEPTYEKVPVVSTIKTEENSLHKSSFKQSHHNGNDNNGFSNEEMETALGNESDEDNF